MLARIQLATLLLLLPTLAFGGGVTSAPGVELQDEAVGQGRVQILNCSGAGIACSRAGVTGTLSVSGGGGGGGNWLETSITIPDNTPFHVKTVTGQAWVTAASQIVCQPFATVADGESLELYDVASLVTVAASRVAGTGFDVRVQSPNGAIGTFRIHCTGA